MKKFYFASILILILGMGWIFLGSKKHLSHPKNEFRFLMTGEPPTVDWSVATDHISKDIINNIMEGLVQLDENLNVYPAIAESWDISNGGKRYTFHLRKDVLWNDGRLLRAQDFRDGWERLLNPRTASEYAYFLFDIANAKQYNAGKIKDFNQVGVHVKDDHTLVVNLWQPASYFISLHSFWVTFPLRKDIIEHFGNQWTNPENIVTLGPFKLKLWEHDYRVVLENNPLYYGKKPKIEKITAYIVNEDSTALSLYETGKIDIIRKIPPVAIAKYKTRSDYYSWPFLRGYYYGFNTKKKPFDDVRVRRAFAMAIDRTQFPKILGGNQIPLTSWVPKGMPGYEPLIGLNFNMKKAREWLAVAGYPDGKGFPKFQMVYDSRDDNKIVAENLQNQLKENLNVEAEILNHEWKIHLKQLDTDPPHFWRLGWGADFPDPDNFLNLFTSYSGNNKTRWANAEYDQLIAAGAREFDPEKRLSLYRRAQQILTEEDVPIIPLFIESINYLIQPHVHGYRIDAMETHILKNVTIQD